MPLDVQSYFIEALSDASPLSLRTLHGYASDFHVFWNYYLKPRGITDLKQVTPDLLRGFLAFLRVGYSAPGTDGRPRLRRVNSGPGLARKKAALRTIFFFLTTVRHLYDHDPTASFEERRTRRRGGKIAQKLPIYLDEADTGRLQLTAEQGKDRYKGYEWLNLRNFAIISLLIGTGIRVSELTMLSEHSFTSDLTVMHVVGKGNKPRTVPVSGEVQEILRLYREYRRLLLNVPKEYEPLLFLNRRFHPLSPKGVHDIVREYCDRAGIYPSGRHVSPHKLRHTAATNWYRRGLDLYMLQKLLGHANPQTTEIYTHVMPREVIEAVRRLDEKPNRDRS